MTRNRNQIVAGSLLAATFMIVGFSRKVAAEEYVWARFYGSNLPTGYSTDGFGSYYVPKSMVNSKLQTDPIRKPGDKKPAAKKPAETKAAEPKTSETQSDEPVDESQTPKREPQTKKSLWKRFTFRK